MQPTRNFLLSLLSTSVQPNVNLADPDGDVNYAVGVTNGTARDMGAAGPASGALFAMVDGINAPATGLTVSIQDGPAAVGPWTTIATTPTLAPAGVYFLPFLRTQRFIRFVVDVASPGGGSVDGTMTLGDFGTTGLPVAYCGVYQDAVVITPDLTLADLVEANYTGYARQAVVWRLPHLIDADIPTVRGEDQEFRPTAVLAAEQPCNGFFIADAATGGNLLFAEAFDAVFTFIDTLSAKTVTPGFQVPADSNFGDSAELE